MADHRVDGLLVASKDEGGHSGRGSLKYMTDVSTTGGRSYALLPRVGDPVLTQSGHVGRGWAETYGWVTDIRIDVDQVDAVISAIRDLGLHESTVGLAGTSDSMAVYDYNRLRTVLPGLTLVAADDWFDDMRAAKSEEEIRAHSETVEIIDNAIATVYKTLEPGITERQLVASLLEEIESAGGAVGTVDVANSTNAPGFRPPQDASLEYASLVGLRIAYRGPDEYAAVTTRYVAFAEPDPATASILADLRRISKSLVDGLRPGVDLGDLVKTVSENATLHGGAFSWTASVSGLGLEFGEAPRSSTAGQGVVPGRAVLAVRVEASVPDGLLSELVVEDTILVSANGASSLFEPSNVVDVLN